VRVAVVAHRDKLDARNEQGLRAALGEAGLTAASWTLISKGKHAAAVATEAVDEGAEVVIVGGGDGTVRAGAGALVHRQAALAVLPVGTANLFAGALQLPVEPADVVAMISSGQRRTIDTGRCNGEPFIVMAGTGFDAAMVDAADSSKERLGMIAYLRAGFHEARTRRPFEAKVVVDGKEIFSGEGTSVIVGNVGTLKGGVVAFPGAAVDDGLLDVGIVTAEGMRQWASLMVATVRKRQRESPHAQLSRGREISIALDGKHRFQLDGGAKGTSKRLHIEVIPASLTVCAPVTPAS
jgi:YegS/Rv2252/BmrU family lipid kinase